MTTKQIVTMQRANAEAGTPVGEAEHVAEMPVGEVVADVLLNAAVTLQSGLQPGSHVASLGSMPTTPIENRAMGDEHAGTFLATPAPQHVSPNSSRYLLGAVLSGKYRLDALLGEGGMGSVWRATNLLLELPVAIKLIRADLDRSSLRARLQLEARSVAKLGHPGIVRIFDVGESELGDPFIVMELLQGETLARIITRGRLSSAYAVQLLLPIIDALHTAHARGIVHRDLKPDNLMIALEEQHVQPKILDFGIAKLTGVRDSDHKLTEAGTVVGSPDYMSPEQARGREDVDASTDIWSICVVLYEAVTGSAPFAASNYNALLRAIVEDEPISIVQRAAGDEQLWAIIQRGLAKDRRDRFPNMNELGRALATWLVSHGVREDAAGASVDSKWLGRSSDPSSLGQRGTAVPASSNDFQPKLTQESHPGGTGVGRGPFTATILPHTKSHKRLVGVVVAVCAVFALGAAGVSLRGRSARVSSPTGLNPSLASVAIAPAVPAPSLPSEGVPPARAAEREPLPPPAAATSPTEVTPITEPPSNNAALVKKLAPRAATVVAGSTSAAAPKPGAGTAAASKGTPSSAVPAAAPPKTGDRPLDLLAPY